MILIRCMIGQSVSTTLKSYSIAMYKIDYRRKSGNRNLETRHSIHLKMIKDFQLLALCIFLKLLWYLIDNWVLFLPCYSNCWLNTLLLMDKVWLIKHKNVFIYDYFRSFYYSHIQWIHARNENLRYYGNLRIRFDKT